MAGAPKADDLATELGVEDLYEFLGVRSDSTEKEVTRAYRKKALVCHPDKNPDDPKAADRFQKLSKAYSILTDPAAKAAYDKWLRAKHAAKKRHEELSVKRKKLKESLENRENQHLQGVVDEREAARRMQKEIERLREEGSLKIKEQQELLRQQLLKQGAADDSDEDSLPTLKVTWKAKKSDVNNGGYSQQLLEDIFSQCCVPQFGPLHHVLVSSKRTGKALVSFRFPEDAEQAVQSACGLAENPLKVTWVCGKPRPPSPPSVRGGGDEGLTRDSDYESLTLMRLRQAEERKRLCQQLAQEDLDS